MYEESQKTTLYRIFSGHDLLYIGISQNVLDRFHSHRRKKDWFVDADWAKFEHFENRETALWAEEIAIKSEKPLYNIVHNGRNKIVRNNEAQEVESGVLQIGDRKLKTDEFLISSRASDAVPFLVARLWLYPEIEYSSVLSSYFENEMSEDQAFHMVCDEIRKKDPKNWELNEIPIFWSICGTGRNHHGQEFFINEWAPFSSDAESMPHMPNFLDRFEWPINYKNQPINFMSLPVVNHRFPKFARSLEWAPSAYQKTVPMRTIYEMKQSLL